MHGQFSLPRWGWMWVIAVAIYLICKAVTWSVVRSPVPLSKRLGYWFGWPGLDAAAFVKGRAVGRPAVDEWIFAISKTGFGLLCLSLTPHAKAVSEYWAGWLAMLGIIFSLHFGLFQILSCIWRSKGVAAEPLMNWPVAARSLSDFWGNRWNRAFRDLTHKFLLRPLSHRLGPVTSLIVVFLFSGLVHELAITVPAGGGYGGPAAYFALQGAGLLVERSAFGRKLHLRSGNTGRCFAAAFTVLPVCWLFPEPFVTRIALPFVMALNGLQ